MINILYTINFLTNGGPTRVLQNIISELDRKKYNITIITLINQNDNDIVETLRSKGVNIIELNYNKKLSEILKHKKEIIYYINKKNPDIIHTHGIVSTIIVASDKIKTKKITTIHNNIYEDYKYTYGFIKGFLFAKIHLFYLKKYDMTVCCSKTSYDIIKNNVKNITYIRNGIDINRNDIKKGEIRKELQIDDNDVVYVYGGVITKRKRVVELVKMFKGYHRSDEKLLIVGDGTLLEEAKIYADDNIIFLGFKTNILDYFKCANVYISNSSSEGFSISLIEALGCNLLCLISNIPSHKECFEIDNETYIGEFFDEKSFKEKKEIIYNKIKKENNFQTGKFQTKYLSAKSMTDSYEKIYKKLKGEK